MEFTREIYWNIGKGWLTLVPMYLITVIALSLLVRSFLLRIKVYRKAQPLNRLDDIRRRLRTVAAAVLLQRKVVQGGWPGMVHGLFFWCFCILFLGTVLVFIQVDVFKPLFGYSFLAGRFYAVFSLALDLAGLFALLMLVLLFCRRYVLRPEGLEIKREDGVTYGLLFLILISGFLLEGARVAVTEIGKPEAVWSPVGLATAKLIVPVGEQGLLHIHSFMWWFHLLLTAVLIILIPLTRLRHIFTSSTNYLFADHGPKGKPAHLDLEDEEAESFGASFVNNLSWKDILDTDACTLCKRCQDRCPAWSTDKPLSPMKLVSRIGDLAFHDPDADLISAVGKETIWACTACRACEESCPVSIEHVSKINAMRRSMVLMEGEFAGEEVMRAMEQTEINGNPLGRGFASRGEWLEGLGVKPVAEDREVDILYFVGCYGSFDSRNRRISQDFVRLCQAAGIRVGVLGKEEKCCGEPMRKMGNEYLYQNLAVENIQRITAHGVRKIVTTCPHCFNTLEKDYRDLGFQGEVVFYTTYLQQLISSGQLKINIDEPFSCTYHDSCSLGRNNDMYRSPRELIALAGGRITEMEKHLSETFCCGGGGGRILAEENIGERINARRTGMALETKAPVVVSNCPFCLTMFEDGIKGIGVKDMLQPKDIAEILAERIERL